MKTVVVIPTYDEKDNVGPMAEAVLASAPDAELLFVDDNSPDGTGDVIEGLMKAEPRRLEKNHVAPPPSQEEALSRYSASGEVPR